MNTKEIISNIENQLNLWDKPEILKKCFSFIDLTSLNTQDTDSKIGDMIDKVNRFSTEFPDFPQVAAVCVYPNFAKVVKTRLKSDKIKIAVVSGVFPSSQSFEEVKILESKLAVEHGANEVDIVLSLNKFLSGNYEKAKSEISSIKKAIGSAHLKVILESGLLAEEELIYKASMLSLEAGADFIKTSTGKCEPAATLEAAVVMCKAISEFHKITGEKRGFKPAGGIVTKEDAIKYYAIVETILGEEWLNPTLFRLGASRLANNLLSDYYKSNIKFY